jgi:putative endonuclease
MRFALACCVDRQSLGKLGESLACAELTRRGYAILATRYRTRFGEIDIISDAGGVTVFVEVKARRSTRKGSALDAVSPAKRRRVAAMALDYLAWTGRLDAPCRFDVVAIDHIGSDRVTIQVIENAWQIDR